MPLKPLKPCGKSGCPALVRDTHYCPDHARLAKQYDQERGSAAKRGYGSKWKAYRERFLRKPENIMCNHPDGCNELSTDVDHIIPVKGPNDPLFWKPSNHQALCHGHHSAKTRQDMAKGLTR